ncbi:CoA transferase [Nonomuraea sp. M3C6]|uniref:CoA transferase n=1 Tax=Nonomuraea marmarensis TaxID=3351344 RepID=A0ABW7AAJ6_9ACTN
MGVLDGYRVVDLSIAMAGPLAAMRLGDLGADVVKVEPVTGEWQRHTPAGGATGNRVNASFLSLNRNKRSLAVNLKSDEGREIVHRLAATADVFLQNYRPGVAERLGMDYDTISGLNPGIVYVSMSGYGETGPYTSRPGQDLLLQAMSGAMLSTGREGDPPAPAGTYAIDAITAYSAFEGALAALLHRERTGEGQRVSVNMLDAAIAVQMQELSIFTVGGVPQRRGREPHGHTYIRAPYGVSSGRTVTTEIGAVPGPSVLASWRLRVEDWRPGGTPSETSRLVHELALDRLAPWSDIPELADVSGVGTYTTRVDLDWDGGAYLELGEVTDTCRVTVNGRRLDPVDQVNPVVDVGPHLRRGSNTIEVRVATPLGNRLRVADPAVYGGLARQAYGLVGPVRLVPYREARVGGP